MINKEINVDEGFEIVDRILENYPDHWNLMHYKGLALFKKELCTEALELLRTGWEKKPLYNHVLFLHLQEAKKTVASLNLPEFTGSRQI